MRAWLTAPDRQDRSDTDTLAAFMYSVHDRGMKVTRGNPRGSPSSSP